MKRLIPKWIGKVDVPGNRNTTIQLVRCWSGLIEETAAIEPMLKGLEGHLKEDEFLVLTQDITRHLLTRMDELNMKEVNNTMIWIGIHYTPLGKVNGNIAQIMHAFFDHPDMKIGGSHPLLERAPTQST